MLVSLRPEKRLQGKVQQKKTALSFYGIEAVWTAGRTHGNERAQRLEIGWWNETDLLSLFLSEMAKVPPVRNRRTRVLKIIIKKGGRES